MNYVRYLTKTYNGARTLSLGKSIEDFLNANVNPNIPQNLDFNELDRVLQVMVPPRGSEDFICKKMSPLEDIERWGISSGRKPNFMIYGFKTKPTVYTHIRANLPYNLIRGIDTLVLLSQKMQKDLALRVLPNEIRIMS